MNGALTDKVCLVAGTTGIGGASARLFGREGARVVAIGRTRKHARALARDLIANQIEHLVLAEDISVEGAAERVLCAAVAHFGRIDVLFHVAGISGRRLGDGPLAECSVPGWDIVFATNLRAMMLLNRACLRHWLDHKQRGVILNMSSVLGFAFATEHFDTVAYAASKAAIIALSQHTAATYAKDGIRVNVIAPALVDTPMAARATQSAAIRRFLMRKQPLTRGPLRDEDCARAALFLCSDAAATITGIVLPVDAGWCVSG